MSDCGKALKDGFTWYEKLSMRGGAAAMVAVGAFAIYQSSPVFAAGYLVFVALAGFVVLYDSLCVYCPYPFKYSDCLFVPYQLLTSVVTQRTGPISPFRNLLSALAFGGMVAIPQFWLWGNWSLFGIFWTLAVALGIAVPACFCRRCRHHRCPMNLARPS